MFERPTSGSVVCPGCGRLVGVRDERCYECGRAHPGLWGFAPLLKKLGLELDVTYLVLAACGVMYVLTLIGDPSAIGTGGILSLLSPGQRPLFAFGASGAVPVFGYGRWWTVLSAAWLHGGLLHIGMNVLWLRQLMPVVEDVYGPGRLLIVYTASAVAGFGVTSVMGLFPFLGPLAGAGLTVGASAPLFGLFGALIVYSRISGDFSVGRQIWRWVVIFVVIGLLVPIIDNWAHLGGFAGGWVAARLLDPSKGESAGHLAAGLACIVLNVAAIVASLVHALPLLR